MKTYGIKKLEYIMLEKHVKNNQEVKQFQMV